MITHFILLFDKDNVTDCVCINCLMLQLYSINDYLMMMQFMCFVCCCCLQPRKWTEVDEIYRCVGLCWVWRWQLNHFNLIMKLGNKPPLLNKHIFLYMLRSMYFLLIKQNIPFIKEIKLKMMFYANSGVQHVLNIYEKYSRFNYHQCRYCLKLYNITPDGDSKLYSILCFCCDVFFL